MPPIRTLQQRYWFSPRFPFLECRSTWQSRQPYKTHSHAQLSIGCLEHGSTQCHTGENSCLLNAGDVIVIPPGLPHSCHPLPGKTRSYHMLYLDPLWCARQFERANSDRCSLISDIVTYSSETLFQQVMRIVRHLHTSQLSGVESDLQSLLVTLSRRPFQAETQAASPSDATRYVQQRLLANLQDAPSLTVLAQELALCPETVVRRFRQETGMTPMAYLHNARVEHAKTLIRQGETLADTGYACGFSDQSHFHRTFVNFTAATPGQYRQARSIFHNK